MIKKSRTHLLFLMVGALILVFGIFIANSTDAAGPKIFDIRVAIPEEPGNSVVIGWKTDVTTTSKIEFGTSTGVYTRTIDSSSAGTSHSANISDIEYQKTYYYRISATDLTGTIAISEESLFITKQKFELHFKIISVIEASHDKALTDVERNGSYSESSSGEVLYGTSPDMLTNKESITGAGSFFLQNLNPETTYYFTATVNYREQSITSSVQSFKTKGAPIIESVNPSVGAVGTLVTISGKNFGKGPDELSASYNLASIGCNMCMNEVLHWPEGGLIQCKEKNDRCFADLISWGDSKIVIKVTNRSRTGEIFIGKSLFYAPGCSGRCPTGHMTLFTTKGPIFTVISPDQPVTNIPQANKNVSPQETQYLTELYSCKISTTTSDATTLKVKTLFTKGSETDIYLQSIYDAYKKEWVRAPRCDELQFHLDHSTSIERLTEWLRGKVITERFDCKISTTAGSNDTLLVKEPLTLGSEANKYLESVVNAYTSVWGRDPRCDELQFHLDHSTSLTRLQSWLKENKLSTEIKEQKEIVFTETDGKVVLKNASQSLQFGESDIITFSGKTIPNAFVALTISSEPIIATVLSNTEGDWAYTLPGPLESGEHAIKIAVSDKDGKKVSESDTVSFRVGSAQQPQTSPSKAIPIWWIWAAVAAIVIIFLALLLA